MYKLILILVFFKIANTNKLSLIDGEINRFKEIYSDDILYSEKKNLSFKPCDLNKFNLKIFEPCILSFNKSISKNFFNFR